MIDREHCKTAARQVNEAKDCTVRACAVATQIDYHAVRDYLAGYGRKSRQGMLTHQYHKALRDLGCRVTKLEGPRYEYKRVWVDGHVTSRNGFYFYREPFFKVTRRKVAKGKDYDAATVRTLQRELPHGTYLVETDAHVLCMRDGVVEDGDAGRLTRIESVYRVEY